MRRGTNLPAVGSFNQNVVLDMIRRSPEGISRADIAAITGLVPQTISNAARRFIDDGLVVEAGTQVRGRGKPPTMLKLNPRSRYAIGVNLDPVFVECALVDLAGDVIAQAQTRPPSPDPDAVIAHIVAEIDALIESAGIDRDLVMGVGIGVPGPIDAERGVILDPPHMVGWRNVSLRDAVAEATGMQVVFDLAVTAFAAGEHWMGDTDRGNFAVIYMSLGVGTGLVLDGSVYRGKSGNAGDGGRIIVNASGIPRARSQQLGHLVTPPFLVEQAIDEGVLPAEVAMDDNYERLLADAADGSPGALGILHRAGRNLGSAILTLVNVLDLDEIVLGGTYWDGMAPYVLPAVESTVATSEFRSRRNRIVFSTASVDGSITAFGGACLVLDSVFSPTPSSLLIAR
ncbi:ROK family transcriptional regulator [Microbacterium sp. H1-D42]|uniref:ROK family transcriptional regulator n=1 Tax=Microbacterium sp. H1-D42 TaxID=2925844 RepID=UPI001F53BFA2|nr:ROK family transcriptional regulator [Microbacterium sp. H1-D42]UNK70462.1 ROK family transcriptional regulator [Microbacterium sp. H1-D42]